MRDIGEPPWLRVGLVLLSAVLLLVLLVMPVAVVFSEALAKGWHTALDSLADPNAVSAIRLTLEVAAIAVPVNTLFGVAAAWCLVRFRFPGRPFLIMLTALPFSVSPVVAGLVFVLLFGLQGWFGPLLAAHDVHIIFAVPGIVLCTLFVTLPFVARQVMPLMEAIGIDEEEAALTLGASGWQIFRRITLPRIRWALLTGVLLCNARAMGEFGAVAVVSGHISGLTVTVPLQIEILTSGYDTTAAFSLSALLACLALLTILLRGLLEWRARVADDAGQQAVLVRA